MAGAAPKVENVQRFLQDYAGAQTIRLEQNYRSTANILSAANAVIAHNPERLGKQLWTDSGEGELVDLYAAYNEIDEARYVIERIRCRCATVAVMAIARSSIAATRSRVPSKKPCWPNSCRIACMAACASSSAPKSRTAWPICACSPRARTMRRSSARSTRRRVESASARWMKCGGWRVALA